MLLCCLFDEHVRQQVRAKFSRRTKLIIMKVAGPEPVDDQSRCRHVGRPSPREKLSVSAVASRGIFVCQVFRYFGGRITRLATKNVNNATPAICASISRPNGNASVIRAQEFSFRFFFYSLMLKSRSRKHCVDNISFKQRFQAHIYIYMVACKFSMR